MTQTLLEAIAHTGIRSEGRRLGGREQHHCSHAERGCEHINNCSLEVRDDIDCEMPEAHKESAADIIRHNLCGDHDAGTRACMKLSRDVRFNVS